MRKKIAAGNWKMNLSLMEARQLCSDILNVKIPTNAEVILACPSVYLENLAALSAKAKKVHLCAQDAHQALNGAFTGNISAPMLKSIGIEWSLVGHSERRAYHKESDALLKEKVNTLLSENIKVIFCCGEPLKIRKAKKQNSFVEHQLINSLFHLSEQQLENIVIAYEPIWAIGTGETASPSQAQSMHAHIRKIIAKNYNKKIANQMTILYGGSVKPGNANELFNQKDVDGGLVGGASLKSSSFKAIIEAL